MEFLQKHLKILAGAAILLLTLAWFVWPQGDLPRATRLLEKGEYEEAALILDRIVRQRPANREIQILHARALIGAGRFEVAEVVLSRLVRQGMDDELEGLLRIYREAQALQIMALLENDDEAGERLLGKMVNQYLAEEFKAPILFHARRQAELEEWAKVVQAWQWYIKGGWEPPLEFQSHLAKSLFGRSDITEGQREFILGHLDPGHPLAKLSQLLYLKYRYHEISLAVAQDAIQFLNEVSWHDYSEWIESIASLYYKTMEHLWLVEEGKIQPLQGLTPEVGEYVLEFCWSYLRKDLNSLASNRNGDFTSTYAQFLKDPQEFFAYFQDATQWGYGEPWLRGRVMVWRAAALGQAGASEAASYVAGRFSKEGRLIAYAQQEGEGTVSWSGDGDFCALHITSTPRPDFLILEKDSGSLVLQLADASNSLVWAPQGNAFITYSNDSSWQYHAGPGEEPAVLAIGSVHIAGWYDRMTLYTWDYQLYDLEHNQVGKFPDSFTHYWRIDISSAGLVLCYGEGGTNLFNQDHQLVTAGKGMIHQPPWSPSGQKALLHVGYKYSVISQEGIQDLSLPSGSRVQGWMDEDRLLVKRELGYPDNWYVYTISTEKVQYIHPPEGNPESLYPAGDGETVAWSAGGIIYLGRLKLGD